MGKLEKNLEHTVASIVSMDRTLETSSIIDNFVVTLKDDAKARKIIYNFWDKKNLGKNRQYRYILWTLEIIYFYEI